MIEHKEVKIKRVRDYDKEEKCYVFIMRTLLPVLVFVLVATLITNLVWINSCLKPYIDVENTVSWVVGLMVLLSVVWLIVVMLLWRNRYKQVFYIEAETKRKRVGD